MKNSGSESDRILIGHVSSVHGIKGWLKIHSYCSPKENIFSYKPWLVTEPNEDVARTVNVLSVTHSGKTLIARVEGCNDRNTALTWVGSKIYIEESQLEALSDDEFYWRDLLGLEVKNLQGKYLGVVHSFLETGANDVLVVKAAPNDPWGKKERLIPYVPDVHVHHISLEDGLIEVDWDPEF